MNNTNFDTHKKQLPQQVLNQIKNRIFELFKPSEVCNTSFSEILSTSSIETDVHFYLATEGNDDTLLIKVYEKDSHCTQNNDFINLINTEFSVAYYIDHDCIIPNCDLHSFECDGKCYFMITSKYWSNTLDEVSYDSFPISHIRSTMYQVLLGLNVLFKENMIHTNLSVKNVYIDKSGCCALGNINSAKNCTSGETVFTKQLPETNTEFLTLAPETIFTQAQKEASDVYQAGILFIQLLFNNKNGCHKDFTFEEKCPADFNERDKFKKRCKDYLKFLGGIDEDTCKKFLKTLELNISQAKTVKNGGTAYQQPQKDLEVFREVLNEVMKDPKQKEKPFKSKINDFEKDKHLKNCLGMIEKMLEVNPEKRAKISDLLRDPFFKKLNSWISEHLFYKKNEFQNADLTKRTLGQYLDELGKKKSTELLKLPSKVKRHQVVQIKQISQKYRGNTKINFKKKKVGSLRKGKRVRM